MNKIYIMSCVLLTRIIFLSKANTNVVSVFEDKYFLNTDEEAIGHSERDHPLSTEDKKKILQFLKSFSDKNSTPPTFKLLENPTGYCRSFHTCYECVKSMWYPCGWCHNYGCTDQLEKLCAYAVTRDDLAHTNSTDDIGKLCAHIEHQGPILVPAGIRDNIQVKIYTTDPILYEKEIICQLQLNDRHTHLKALILDDVVYCYPVTLDTMDDGETNNGYFRLIWGGVQPFSNVVPIKVYRCENLAIDCESCRLIPSEYGCGWCRRYSKCLNADDCNDILVWNINRLTCKSLEKKMFYV